VCSLAQVELKDVEAMVQEKNVSNLFVKREKNKILINNLFFNEYSL